MGRPNAVKRFHGEFTLRSQAILASLHEAVVTAPEPMPDVEFWWPGTDSVPTGPHFGLNRVDSNRDGDQMWLLVRGDVCRHARRRWLTFTFFVQPE